LAIRFLMGQVTSEAVNLPLDSDSRPKGVLPGLTLAFLGSGRFRGINDRWERRSRHGPCRCDRIGQHDAEHDETDNANVSRTHPAAPLRWYPR
jgi:hypothetical protein